MENSTFALSNTDKIGFDQYSNAVLHTQNGTESIIQIRLVKMSKTIEVELYLFESLESLKVRKYVIQNLNLGDFKKFFETQINKRNWNFENGKIGEYRYHIYYMLA